MLPCGRLRFGKITIILFEDVALRAASILKSHIFCILCMSSKSQNTFIWMYLSIGGVFECLVLKNAAECISQRAKRPSGARVMTCSRSRDRAMARSLGRLIARSIAHSIARSLARSIARSIARWIALPIARSSLGRSIVRSSLGRSIARSIACSLDRSLVA